MVRVTLGLFALGAVCAVLAHLGELDGIPSARAQDQPTIDDPVVLRVCVACHNLERVVTARKTPEEWLGAIERMRRYGAPIDEGEVQRISSYLAALLPRPGAKPSVLDDDLVRARCSQCHGLELVEANRKTPEGWSFTVQHMRWLSQKATMAPVQTGVQAISKEEGDRIAAYLSQKLPLLPGEKDRLDKLVDPIEVQLTCGGCHGLETLKSQVKTMEAWDKTIQRMHHFKQGWGYMWSNGYSPVKIAGLTEEAALKVIKQWLYDNYSSDSEEWKRYTPEEKSFAGSWRIQGQDHNGPFFGTLELTPGSEPNSYGVTRTVQHVGTLPKDVWKGSAVIYANASLRTRYTWTEPKSLGFLKALDREKDLLPPGVPIVARGSFERELSTTADVFSGSYHFDGIPGQGGTETYTRDLTGDKAISKGDPQLIAVVPNVLRRGQSHEVLVVGTNLVPFNPASFSFGPGIKVERMTATEWAGATSSPRLLITVAKDAPLGAHDVNFKTTDPDFRTAKLPDAVNVIGGVDYIQVEHNHPEYGPIYRVETTTVPVARLGGAPIYAEGAGKELARPIPKVRVQLRGIGFANGPDGKKGTGDDVRIGEVAVVWSASAVDVTKTRPFNGGDVPTGNDAELPPDAQSVELPGGLGTFKYCVNPEKQKTWGTLSADGLFTPGSEEPRVELEAGPTGKPKPKTYQTNTGDNRGTVLVTATYKGDLASKGAGPIEGHMIVVLGPPKWTTWTPFNDAAPGTYYPARAAGPGVPSPKLSDTGLFADTAKHALDPERIPYDVASPLWSDFAHKDRSISFPAVTGKNDKAARMTPVDGWDFPAGTSIVKNFYLERKRGDASSKQIVETRVLLKRGGGWQGFSYEWNDAGTDATLLDGGKEKAFTVDVGGRPTRQVWSYPSRSDCFRCHTQAAGTVLGLQTSQLSAAQIETFKAKGVNAADVKGAKPLVAVDGGGSLEERARSYLHVNCSTCHRPGGGAPTSFDLRAGTPLADTGIVGAEPKYGDMGVAGARIVKPGDPKQSLLYIRMTSTGSSRMPPLASSHVDPAAERVLAEWISSLK